MRIAPLPNVALGLLTIGALAAPVTAEVSRDNFSLSLTITTDYVYRGVSANAEDPAFQFGLDFEHPSGVFAGIWGTDTEIPPIPPATKPREWELDYYLGYGFALSTHWFADLTGILYTYPEDDPVKSYDYVEWVGSVHFSDRLSLSVAHSTDVLGLGVPATDYEASLRIPLERKLDLDLGYGHWDIGEGYSYWGAGLSRPFGRWLVTVDYIDTDSTAQRVFRDAAGERVAIGVTFYAL